MHVLVYYPGNLNRLTGTPIRTMNLVEALCRCGVEVTLLADNASEDSSAGYRFFATQSHSNWRERSSEIRSLLRERKPDLLYGITHNALLAGTVSALATRIPHVVDLHSIVVEELAAGGVSQWQRLKLIAVERLCLPLCKGVTVVCHPLKEHYQRLHRNIEVIHGAADVRQFNPQVPPAAEIEGLCRKDAESVVVGYIGNLRPYQGVKELFETALRITKLDADFQFVFIGNGPLKDTLVTSLGKSQQAENIHFLPERPYQEIPNYLAACDLLVIPRPSNRITEYAFPSKLPEYLAMGKPVITTDVGDAKKFVKSGETGFLVSPGDTKELETAILAQKTYQTHRLRVARNASRLVEENHTWDARARKLSSFFGRLTQ